MKYNIRQVSIDDYDEIYDLWNAKEQSRRALNPANAFWEKQGYSLRTNLNYRNKSLNTAIPAGE